MDYFLHVAVVVVLYAVLGISFNLLLGYTGLFAVSHAAFYGIGAYASALLARGAGSEAAAAALAGMALAVVVGGLLALPALRVSGDYLVIVSFGFQVIAFSIMLNWEEVTRGAAGIPGVPRPRLLGWALSTPGDYLPLYLALGVLAALFAWRIASSPLGRVLRAIREDEVAAQALGKNVTAHKIQVFMVAGAMAALAGSLYVHYVTYVSPASFTLDESIFIMAVVIVGGTGNLLGSVLGAVLLVALPEALRFLQVPTAIAGPLRQVLYGLLLVLFMRFRPQGLLGEPLLGGGVGEAVRGRDERVPAALVAGAANGGAAARSAGAGGGGEPLLTVDGLAKRFGGVQAVEESSLALRPGRVTALIGPNGAGKTTLFNLITGFHVPDAGRVRYRGTDVTARPPYRIARLGLARSFQDLRLFMRMTALENVLVARPGQRGERLWALFLAPWRVAREEREHRRRATEVLAFVGLAERAGERAENLSYAEQKLLALARLIAMDADLLLLDEPTSGLDPATIPHVLGLLRRVVDGGRTICVIEHNLEVVKGLSDWVVFLDQGRVLAEGTPDEIMADRRLAEIYLGR